MRSRRLILLVLESIIRSRHRLCEERNEDQRRNSNVHQGQRGLVFVLKRSSVQHPGAVENGGPSPATFEEAHELYGL